MDGCDFDLLDRRPDVFGDVRQWRDHVLRLFVVVFGRDSFLPDEQGETFHQLALREGKRWEARVARSLSDTVFETILPGLAQGLAAADAARPRPTPPTCRSCAKARPLRSKQRPSSWLKCSSSNPGA